MKTTILLIAIATVISCNVTAQSKKYHEPQETEVWKPDVKVVAPGNTNAEAPEDAIILFNGVSLSEWESGEKPGVAADWTIANGELMVKPSSGSIQTKKTFQDFQLHIEFATPEVVKGEGQGRGNSGVFLGTTDIGANGYEIQVLDNYDNKTYVNGQAGSVYKQTAPLVNVCKKPGEWQTYDIIWTAPRFKPNGRLKSPARVTVIQNGVLVQNNTVFKGVTVYKGPLPFYKSHGKLPIKLQDHGDLVKFRNIWLRQL